MKTPKARRHQQTSPLHTSPAARAAKAAIIAQRGRDSDGAFRAFNRKDTAA